MALVVGAVEVLAIPACGEDDGLSDHFASLGLGDIDSVGSSARSAANEWGVARRCPTTMADVGLGCLVGVAVGSVTSQHTETLQPPVSHTNC
jgi:hypothetical protein